MWSLVHLPNMSISLMFLQSHYEKGISTTQYGSHWLDTVK